MAPARTKEEARIRIGELVRHFQRNERDHLAVQYNETQARTDFITPLLEVFGWDVLNAAGHPLSLREVVEEATVEVGEELLSKRPDYELRLSRQRKLFVEAKKPSVKIDRDLAPAFQTRRYGYSASLPISVLTNFYELAVYDCRPVPLETDQAHVARIFFARYDDFERRFDELWELFSREAVYSGAFDLRFHIGVTHHGTEQFDEYFLGQVRGWRERLAIDIHQNTPGLTATELSYAVQLFLSRIVFLRICEDRNVEQYETLKHLGAGDTFRSLMALLRRADEFYDSGLFDLLADERLRIGITDATLHSIIEELYYPRSPYTFSVVQAEVLGKIYEQFLGEAIQLVAGAVVIVDRPEVVESGGVVPTPQYIVDEIVERTLGPVLENCGPDDLANLTVADISCGSGVFLISAYQALLAHYLAWYTTNRRAEHVGQTIYEQAGGRWRLTFAEKRRILTNHIRGVDIDPDAVEIARFSLLLKLIEDESTNDLEDFVAQSHERALPSLNGSIRFGNSLVGRSEWTGAFGAMSPALAGRVRPFNWSDEFPLEIERGGFDAIVGNPPYIRIQHMTAYSPEEVAFYRDPGSPYTTARQDNFDKYGLFIERALALIRRNGRVGFIVPHKFMTIQSGRLLRRLLTNGQVVDQIVHFGVNQIFGADTSNYTCLLIVDRRGCNDIALERVEDLRQWRYGVPGTVTQIPAQELTEDAWQFADAQTRAVFERVRVQTPTTLERAAEIFVGVQTSADDVYIFEALGETPDAVVCRWNDQDWLIERGVLRPSLHDVQLASYGRPHANSWMIFPYDLAGAQRAALIQPIEFERRFPVCWAYLNARRAELVGRDIVGGAAGARQWYQYGRSQSLTKFDSPKIILPALSLEPRYAYDDTNIIVTGGGNGPYYLIRPRNGAPVTVFYLMAILCHPLAEALVRTNTSVFRGGYYSHGKQFIADIPIPLGTPEEQAEISGLVERLINTLQAAAVARTPDQRTLQEREARDLRLQIEGRVTALFHLSPLEATLIRAVPIPI